MKYVFFMGVLLSLLKLAEILAISWLWVILISLFWVPVFWVIFATLIVIFAFVYIQFGGNPDDLKYKPNYENFDKWRL